MERSFREIYSRPLLDDQNIRDLFEVVQNQPTADVDSQWQKQVLLRILGAMHGKGLDVSPQPPTEETLSVFSLSDEQETLAIPADLSASMAEKLMKMNAPDLVKMVQRENLGADILEKLKHDDTRKTVCVAAAKKLNELSPENEGDDSGDESDNSGDEDDGPESESDDGEILS